MSDEARRQGTEDRFNYSLKLLNIRGAEFIKLITDLDSQKAFEHLMDGDILSVKAAATRLAVSVSILNSIMADHGKVRYSAATLADVLKKIAPKDTRNR